MPVQLEHRDADRAEREDEDTILLEGHASPVDHGAEVDEHAGRRAGVEGGRTGGGGQGAAGDGELLRKELGVVVGQLEAGGPDLKRRRGLSSHTEKARR